MTRIGVVGTPLNHAPAAHSTIPNILSYDRGDYNGYGGYGYGQDYNKHQSYGWKENKKGPQAALNALTLLAFLFFLNVLQSCLRDAMLAAQAPTMIVMVEPTTSEVRTKRDIAADGSPNHLLGDTGTLTPKTWSDQQISELVNNHVQSYWSNREIRSNFIDNSVDISDLTHLIPLHHHKQKSIRDDTQMYSFLNQSFHRNDFLPNPEVINTSQDVLYSKWNRTRERSTTNQSSSWWKLIKMGLSISKPIFKKVLCSDMIICNVQKLEDSLKSRGKHIFAVIRQRLDWLCYPKGDIPQEDCRIMIAHNGPRITQLTAFLEQILV